MAENAGRTWPGHPASFIHIQLVCVHVCVGVCVGQMKNSHDDDSMQIDKQKGRNWTTAAHPPKRQSQIMTDRQNAKQTVHFQK